MLRTPRTFHTTYTHGVEVYATGRFQHPVYRYAADDSPLPADVNETLRRHCGDRASEVLVLCDVSGGFDPGDRMTPEHRWLEVTVHSVSVDTTDGETTDLPADSRGAFEDAWEETLERAADEALACGDLCVD